ncbi:MAG: hypothetical protein J6C97_04745, partial [Clostridia bacterium]|nr:hypothetical protein [Clostridia bacterium]
VISGKTSGTYFDDYLTLSGTKIQVGKDVINVGQRLNFAVKYIANDYVENVGTMYVNTKKVTNNDVGVSVKIGREEIRAQNFSVNISKYDLTKASIHGQATDGTFVDRLRVEGDSVIDNFDESDKTPSVTLVIPKSNNMLREKTYDNGNIGGLGTLIFSYDTDGANGDLVDASVDIKPNISATIKGDNFINEKTNLVATLTKTKFTQTINYKYNSGTTAYTSVSQTLYYKQTYKNINTPYLNGYSYSSSKVGGNTVLGNQNIEVVYTPRNYTITIDPTTNGTIKVNGNSTTFTASYGSTLTLSSTPNSKYKLAYYTKNGTYVGSQNTFVVTNSTSFGAVFTPYETAYFGNNGPTVTQPLVTPRDEENSLINSEESFYATTDMGTAYISYDKFYFEAELQVTDYLTIGGIQYNKLGLWFSTGVGEAYSGMFVCLNMPSNEDLGADNLVVACPVINGSFKWDALSEKEKNSVKSKNATHLNNYKTGSVKLGVYKSGGTYSIFINGKYLFSETNTLSAGANYVAVRGWGVAYKVLSANYYLGLPYTFGSAKIEEPNASTSYGKTTTIGGTFSNDVVLLSAKRQGTNVYDSTVDNLTENTGTNYNDNYDLLGAYGGYINTNYFTIRRNYITIETGLTNQWYGSQAVTLEFSDGTTQVITINSTNLFSSNFDETNVYAEYIGSHNTFIAQDTNMDSVELDINRKSMALKYTPSLYIRLGVGDQTANDNGILTIANYHNCDYIWWKYGTSGQMDVLNFPESGTIIVSFDYSAYLSNAFVFHILDTSGGESKISLNSNYNSETGYYTGHVEQKIDVSELKGMRFYTEHNTSATNWSAMCLYIDNFVIALEPTETDLPSDNNYLTRNHAEFVYGNTNVTLPGEFENTTVKSLTRKGVGDWDTTSNEHNFDSSAGVLDTSYVTVTSTGITIKEGLLNQIYDTETFRLVLDNGDVIKFSLTSNMVWYTNYDETTTIYGSSTEFSKGEKNDGNIAFTQDSNQLSFTTKTGYGRVVKYMPIEKQNNGVLTFRNIQVDSSDISLWWDFNFIGESLTFFFDYYITGGGNYYFETINLDGTKKPFELTKGTWTTYTTTIDATKIKGWWVYSTGVTGDNSNYMLFDNIGIVDNKYITIEPISVKYGQDSVLIPYTFDNGITITSIQKFGTNLWDTTYTNTEKDAYAHTNYDANSGYLDLNDATITTSGITLNRDIINQCYDVSTFKVVLSNGSCVYFQLKSNQLYFTNFKTTNILELVEPGANGNMHSTQDAAMREIKQDIFDNLSFCYTPSNAVLKHSQSEGDNGVFTFQKSTSGTGWIWSAFDIGTNFYITFDYILNNDSGNYRLVLVRNGQEDEPISLTASSEIQHFYMEFTDSSIIAFRICADNMASGCMYIDNFGFGNL